MGSDKKLITVSGLDLNAMKQSGFVLLGGGADSPDLYAWLTACGVKCSSGTMTGVPVGEDELILDTLASEQA